MGRDGDMGLLAQAAVAWVRGDEAKMEISGTPEQVDCLRECLVASRALYEELNAPGRSTTRVVECLTDRRRAARRFRRLTGRVWPL